MKKRKTSEILAQVETFLGDFRKEAESEMETVDIKDLENKDNVTTAQKDLGPEQVQAAKDAGSTVATDPANSEEAGKKPTDNQGVKTLDVDQTVEGSSDVIGTVQKTEIGMEQKVARAEHLGNAILRMVGGTPQEINPVLEAMIEKSASVAQDSFNSHLMGQIQRAIDEQELATNGGLGKEAGQYLDKLAEEDPNAVLPEGMAPMEELAPEVAPEEAAMDAGAEGVGDDEELNQLVGALDQAGVSPEELAQAVEEVQALVEAGVDPEELAQGLGELMEEELPPEVLKEAADKEAAEQRARVDAIKALISRRQ